MLFVLQVVVDGSQTTLLLDGLRPQTEYTVSVYSMIGDKRSEPLSGTDLTCEQTSPSITDLVKLSVSSCFHHANFPQAGGKIPFVSTRDPKCLN